jgi:hypothetical protein
MAACDEPAASGVAPPAVSLRRPLRSLRPVTVSAESQPVPVSIVMGQPPRHAAGHLGLRECRLTPSDPNPAVI